MTPLPQSQNASSPSSRIISRRNVVNITCFAIGSVIALYLSNKQSSSIESAVNNKSKSQSSTIRQPNRPVNDVIINLVSDESNDLAEEDDVMIYFEEPSPPIKAASSKPIRKIVLLGERHTGTRWMTNELIRCFPSMSVKPRLIRWKHWFQADDGKKHDQTLVISQFRNPYHWVEAMRSAPHHAPNHLYLQWKEFLGREWGMERPKRDLMLTEEDKKTVKCNQGFKYDQLISCVEGKKTDPEYLELVNRTKKTVFSGYSPIYELRQDGSGKPFKSILEMRAAKIQHFVSLDEWDWISKSLVVQYEKLVREGTDFLLTQVENITGVQRACNASLPQIREEKKVPKDYVARMTELIDWEAEALIGYDKFAWLEDEDVDDDSGGVELAIHDGVHDEKTNRTKGQE